MSEKTTEEQLQQALRELESLKIEKSKGKRGWAVFHNMRNKRLGRIEFPIELLCTLTDDEWNSIFNNMRVLQAIPDIFRNIVEYTCMGQMFDVCKEGYTIPLYFVEIDRSRDGMVVVSYEKV